MLRNTLNTFVSATFIMLLGVSSSAKAVLPTGELMGTTTVTFGEDVQESPSKTEVTVTLVPSAPRVSIESDAEEALEPDTAVELTVTITSTANGLDNYVVTAKTVHTDGLVSVGQFTLSELVGPIPLGATAAISIEGRIITVLYDGEADNGNVNGIEADDTVIIGDNEYEYKVASISDTEESSTITLTDAGEDPSIELGTHIVERKTETVTIPSIATLGPDAALDQQVTYSVNARTSETGLEEPDETLIVEVLEALRPPAYDKWVRNVIPERNPNKDEAADNLEELWGVTDAEILDKDWHQAGVTALPDDILEYLVVVRAGNRVDLVNWSVEESAPDFTELVGSITYNAVVGGETVVGNKGGFVDRPGLAPLYTVPYQVVDRNRSLYYTYQVKVVGGDGGGDGGDGGGDGGSFPLTTGECKHDAEGLWAPDMNATKCKGVKWNADNGTDVAKNPVCWDTQTYGRGWQVDGKNPWVVGTATEDNNAAYDCRTKCADESGAVFGHCAADGWWNNETAKSTVCEFAGEQEGLDEVAIGGMGGAQAALFMDDKCL